MHIVQFPGHSHPRLVRVQRSRSSEPVSIPEISSGHDICPYFLRLHNLGRRFGILDSLLAKRYVSPQAGLPSSSCSVNEPQQIRGGEDGSPEPQLDDLQRSIDKP